MLFAYNRIDKEEAFTLNQPVIFYSADILCYYFETIDRRCNDTCLCVFE